MKDLSREGILRMIGMRDTAGFMNKINALFLDIYDENGKLAEYSTQLIVTSKNITLLAQRVTDDEQDIANLTVTAQQISASVSSLQTTVSGHTTSIGQLQITADNLTASVSSLNTTVNGHTTSIGQLQITSNSISNRVTVIEGDYVKEAEISLMVKKDGNGYISNASIKADRIDFTFTQSTNFISGGQTVMNINSNGDLWIKGELKGGEIQGDYTVGTQGNKMQIYVDETVGATKCSGIRGRDSNNNEVINLGMREVEGDIRASLTLNNPNDNVHAYLVPSGLIINSGGSNSFSIGLVGTVFIYAPINLWPTYTALVGQVYLDNGYLKVRTS